MISFPHFKDQDYDSMACLSVFYTNKLFFRMSSNWVCIVTTCNLQVKLLWSRLRIVIIIIPSAIKLWKHFLLDESFIMKLKVKLNSKL